MVSRKAPREMLNLGSARYALREAMIKRTQLGIVDTSPLISATPELVRVFSNAKIGYNGIQILGIDMQKMGEGTLVTCNHLRRRLRLDESELSMSEVLAWEGFDAAALVFAWPWDNILKSKLARVFFPSLLRPQNSLCCLECEGRGSSQISFKNPDVQVFDLVFCLVGLGMRPENKATKFMVESFLALSRGETCLRHYRGSRKWSRQTDHADIARWLSISTSWIGYMGLKTGQTGPAVPAKPKPAPQKPQRKWEDQVQWWT